MRSSESPGSVHPPSSLGPHHRSTKNFLLDRHFQLKYTGLLVSVAFGLSAALGGVLWWASRDVVTQSEAAVEQGRAAVKQGQATVERGQQVVIERQKGSRIVEMNIAKEYPDSPDLAKTFQDEAKRDAAALAAEQARLEREANELTERAKELEARSVAMATRYTRLLWVLVGSLFLLTVGMGVAGIVITHRVAGPVHKMKRLLREVGTGRLYVREKLRKGDELQHFFVEFERMVDDLRRRQEAEIARVDRIISRLEGSQSIAPGSMTRSDGLDMLKDLRGEMQKLLDE